MYVEGRGREAYDEVFVKLGLEEVSDEFVAAVKKEEERKEREGVPKRMGPGWGT